MVSPLATLITAANIDLTLQIMFMWTMSGVENLPSDYVVIVIGFPVFLTIAAVMSNLLTEKVTT